MMCGMKGDGDPLDDEGAASLVISTSAGTSTGSGRCSSRVGRKSMRLEAAAATMSFVRGSRALAVSRSCCE